MIGPRERGREMRKRDELSKKRKKVVVYVNKINSINPPLIFLQSKVTTCMKQHIIYNTHNVINQ